uniref:RING-type E3 ubiquitin transferase n=1 Tax=Aegilops tauschii subsp. strangulata TaxID=200361 RepID=A0A453SCG1_AEGTS
MWPCGAAGEQVPVERMAAGVVEIFSQDRRARAQDVFLPFRRLFGSACVQVETVVLEGHSVAEALARYAAESGVHNMVLGSATLSCFRRILWLQDLPHAVLKAMPCSCNVFIVSRHRLTIKLANQTQTDNSNTCSKIQSVSHRAFALQLRSQLQDKQSLHDLPDVNTPKSSGVSSSDSCSQARSSLSNSTSAAQSSESHRRRLFGSLCRKTPGRTGDTDFDATGQLKEFPYVSLSSTEESQRIDEVAKPRKELQDKPMMCVKACENHVQAKKKIQVLSNGCSEDLHKVQDALQWENFFKQKAAPENNKHFRAIEEAEMVKEAFTREAYSKHNAETVTNMATTEKAKVLDALLSTGKSCRRYSRHEIELATENFSDAKKIGEGGYGIVYRCILDHTEVAVKVIQQDSRGKIDEFFKEIDILSRLHHPHLVLLLGFCPEIGCLVYEYMENGSLEDQLIDNEGRQPLHWFLRFQIIFEVARGLAFLHGTKPEPIVHRDLKPGNILLDKNYVSKIGDVGFAKLISDLAPDGFTEYRDDTVIAGTMYYMDPEYQLTGTVRPKSDLFALGIIILQLLTGKRPQGLILSTEEAIRKGTFPEILDVSLNDWPIAEAEMLAKLGLHCTALRCRDRPDLEQEVLPELENVLSRVTSSWKFESPKAVVPSHFICPISQEVMDDPCVAADGHTYERRAIEAWLEEHKISPITKHMLPSLTIIPSHSLHEAIQQWKQSSR